MHMRIPLMLLASYVAVAAAMPAVRAGGAVKKVATIKCGPKLPPCGANEQCMHGTCKSGCTTVNQACAGGKGVCRKVQDRLIVNGKVVPGKWKDFGPYCVSPWESCHGFTTKYFNLPVSEACSRYTTGSADTPAAPIPKSPDTPHIGYASKPKEEELAKPQ